MTDPSDPIIAGDARGPHVRDAGDHLVVVNRNPGRRNALSPLYYETLLGALSRAAANRDCAAVILWGADGYFCSGGDLGQLAHRRDLPEAERRARIEALHDVMRAIKACPCPVIAAIEGGAAGAGLSLALACDLAIASDTATFSAAYVKAGLVPDGGLTYSLSKSLPPATARRIVLFGDPIDARELARFGLINDCVAPGETLAHAEGLARRLAAGPRAAQASIKALMNAAQDADFASQLDRERDAMAAAFAAPEAHEGIQAFLEKRRPHFKNPQDD